MNQGTNLPSDGAWELVRTAEELADAISLGYDNEREPTAPRAELRLLADAGLLTAPLPVALGGHGFGTAPGGHLPLLRTLAAIGGADLALGRLYEGHVNGLILVNTFGTLAQRQEAADDAHAGLLFGVWNTGEGSPMRIEDTHTGPRLQGCKGFATGAALVQRPIVTAERHGWQMTLPRMDSPQLTRAVTVDRSSWHPLGMERSESYTIDFTGAEISVTDLIGEPGDFYRDPLFRGGAIRFAAVQAGALVRLATMFADWLRMKGRGGDPYQLQRMGEISLAAQEAVLWMERAAAVAEACMQPESDRESIDPTSTARMVQCANMTRLAVERLATATMPKVIAGVGAHGLLKPQRFERLLRDLTMYLRQPNPDGTLADVGRSALQTMTNSSDEVPHQSLWSQDLDMGSACDDEESVGDVEAGVF